MYIIILPLLVAIVFGSTLGIIMRRYRISKIRKSTLQKPQYSIEEQLSPAEFGFILDGKVGHKELVGEVIQLYLNGHVTLEKNSSGRIVITRTYGVRERLRPLQVVILKNIIGLLHVPYGFDDVIRYETIKSLDAKGWIVTPKASLRMNSELPSGVIVKSFVLAVVCACVVLGVSVILGLRGLDLYMFGILFVFFEILSMLLVGLFVITKGEMFHSMGAIRGATAKYEQNWQNVNGVYDYIRISGMDIFTPDYESLNFKELDRLYPYAVAAGLDKKVLRLFS